ncbi:MAG: hypothetical protein GX621_16025, partial [Pirellulaceae bacterium]|nr:hypothetical protein [Pirellulaceae bacterium]
MLAKNGISRVVVASLMVLAVAGCRSPYHADRGAVGGGLLGAGMGALIGDASGNAAAGTAIGAGVGALTGAIIGTEMDDAEARNRALIEQKLGREVAAGTVTREEVIAMTNAGVDEPLIVNHIRARGMVAPPDANDLITLKQHGVSAAVIDAMQTSRPPQTTTVVREAAPTPVVVQEYHYGYGPPFHGPPYHRYHYPHARAGVRVMW